ncbi:MAG: hypothetical protein RR048_01275 [Oscillospiraceae bacterium]
MELEILLLIIFTSMFLVNMQKGKSGQFLMFASDDSDIKIAPNNFGGFNANKEWETEDADIYLKHKQKGNIEKAHALGKKLYEIIDAQKDNHNFVDKRFVDIQLKVLCVFLATSRLDEICPDSIVANSAKSIVYDGIRANYPEVYSILSNNATYSMLLLNTSVTINKDISFGKAFAEVCAKQYDREYIDFGVNFYKKYNKIFDEIFENIIFE